MTPDVQPALATDAELAELRDGLEGVTPGPWANNASGHVYSKPLMKTIMKPWNANGDDPIHIARCSPDRIRALLARLDAAERREKELRKALKMTSRRLQGFVGAVGDITDCSGDVDALNAADAALEAKTND